MNVLGIDYGEARTGLAWLSQDIDVVFPLEVISSSNWGVLIDRIFEIVQEKGIQRIVVGLPLNLSSQDTIQTQKVRLFTGRLQEKVDIPVELIDERFTSQMAKRYLRKEQSVDIESARILLEAWKEMNV